MSYRVRQREREREKERETERDRDRYRERETEAGKERAAWRKEWREGESVDRKKGKHVEKKRGKESGRNRGVVRDREANREGPFLPLERRLQKRLGERSNGHVTFRTTRER